MNHVMLIAVLGLSLCAPLFADESQVTDLTIHAQAIESPKLKYQLLPNESEIKPGDAVPILLRLPWERNDYFNSSEYKTLREWPSRRLNDPQWEKFPGAFPNRFFEEMKRAAFRRDAHWEYPIGEEPAYFILLPDVNGLRFLMGSGLAGKARFHLSRGELSEARECILVGLANGRHIAQTPFFVNQLIATAICRSMLDQTVELIAQPNSPNLYWALSTLPDSLVQLNRSANLEANAFSLTFTAANDLDRPRSAAEWQKMAVQLAEVLSFDEARPPEDRKGNGVLALADRGGKELTSLLHVSEDKVAAMSDAEASIRWYVHRRTDYDQRAGAISCLKPIEAWPFLKELQADGEALQEATSTPGIDPISVYLAVWSLNRRVQAMRIVEAARDYLASHEGEFPATLADLKALPIPLDPLTGLSFEWSVDANVAILKAPAPPVEVVPPNPAGLYRCALEFRLRTK